MELEAKLDFWLKHNLNVLLVGDGGVGKTALIKQAFKNAGMKHPSENPGPNDKIYLYYSTPTTDPWVDFVGVPKEVKKDNGTSYLDLIRPAIFENPNIEAVYLDELNRSKDKVRDACMELIQFKSINGKKLPNLKVVWAAINPEDDPLYQVQSLDFAQKDRFHVYYEIPNNVSYSFFENKFGEKVATAATNWWIQLEDNLRKKVSPRRLEYALDMFVIGGDIRDVLPKEINASKLLLDLRAEEPIAVTLSSLFEAKDFEKAKEFLKNENVYRSSVDSILSKKGYLEFFLPLLSQERISLLLTSQKEVQKFVLKNPDKYLEEIELYAKNNNNALSKKFHKIILAGRYFNSTATEQDLSTILQSNVGKTNCKTLKQRLSKFKLLKDVVPSIIKNEIELNQFLQLLIFDIFIPSKDQHILEMKELVPAINHLLLLKLDLYNGLKKTKLSMEDFLKNILSLSTEIGKTSTFLSKWKKFSAK